MQSKKETLIEASSSVLLSYILMVLVQLLILPLFDIQVDLITSMKIGLIFMGFSLAKTFLWRRFWTTRKLRKQSKILD